MTTKPTTPAMGTTTSNSFGALDTASALSMLFDRAAPHLSAEEMDWLADQAPDLAVFHGHNLASSIERIACVVLSDASGTMKDNSAVSDLLLTLAHQVQVLTALGEMGTQAQYLMKLRVQAGKAGV